MPRSEIRDVGHAAIRQRLIDVTLDLVLERGFDNVTLPELAAASGVSRSTYLRYVGSKTNAVVDGLMALGDRVAERLRSRPAHESEWTTLRRGMDVVAEMHGDDGAHPLALVRTVHTNATLSAAMWQHRDSWRGSIARALGERNPARSATACAAIAAAAIACLDVATGQWIESEGALPLDILLDDAFASVSASR